MTGHANIFKAKEKKSENSPDYRGNGTMEDGTPFDIAGWIKRDKNENPYLSLKISEPYQPKEEAPAPAKVTDDELPF